MNGTFYTVRARAGRGGSESAWSNELTRRPRQPDGRNADRSDTIWSAILTVNKKAFTTIVHYGWGLGPLLTGGNLNPQSFRYRGDQIYLREFLTFEDDARGNGFRMRSSVGLKPAGSEHWVLHLDSRSFEVRDADSHTDSLIRWDDVTASQLGWSDGTQVTVTLIQQNPPGAPTDPTARATGSDRIVLEWTAPAATGGADITGYKIEYSTDGGGTWQVLAADTESLDTQYTDDTLPAAATTRLYRVSAINIVGVGKLSEAFGATTPPSVTSVTIVSNPLQGNTYGRHELIEVSVTVNRPVIVEGTPVLELTMGGLFENARYLSGGGTDILTFGYIVEQTDRDINGISIRVSGGQGDGATGLVGTGSVIADAETGVALNRSYPAGGDLGGHKVNGSLQRAIVPAAPGNLTVSPGFGKTALSWTTPADGGSPITKHQVRWQEADASLGAWTDVPDSAPGGENAAGYELIGLTPGTAHTFEVRAENAIGPGAAAEVMVTTRPLPEWYMTLSSATLVEEASVDIVIATRNGVTFDTSLTLDMLWGDRPLFSFVYPPNTQGVNIRYVAPKFPGSAYYRPETHPLVLRFGQWEIARTPLTLEDADPPPEATIAVSAAELTEGGRFRVTATLTRPFVDRAAVPLVVSDPQRFVDGQSVALGFFFYAGGTVDWIEFATKDDQTYESDGTITLALISHPFHPYTLGTPSSVSVKVLDDEPPPVRVSFGSASYAAVEGGTAAAVTVNLDIDPERTLTIPLTVRPRNGATADDYSGLPGGLVFEPGELSRTFSLAAVDDAEDDDGESLDLGFANLPQGVGAQDPSTANVTLGDNDHPEVQATFGAESYDVEESRTVEISMHLSADPGRPVTIPLTVFEGPGAMASDYAGVPDGVRFESGDIGPRTFVFTAVHDEMDEDDETITLAFGTPLPQGVSAGAAAGVTIIDDDARHVDLSTSAVDLDEGSQAEYTIVLASQPTGDVTVAVGGAAGDVTVTGSPMTFTTGNWNDAQTVTVRAAEDEDADPDPDVTLTHTVSGGGYGGVDASDVVVTITENDTAAVTVNPTALTVTEGSSASYAVSLTSEPAGDVTVTVGGVAGDVTVTGSPMTFTTGNWNDAQTVTVRAAEDEDADPDPDVTLTHTVAGGGYGGVDASDVVVTVRENDTAAVTVNPTALTVTEGSSASYAVSLTSEPTGDVTVTVGGVAGDVTVTGSPMTFTTGNWNDAQTVTVRAAEDEDADPDPDVTLAHTVAGGGYAGVAASDVVVTVRENDTAAVTVNPTALTVTEGSSASYAVSLTSEPTGDVTVTVGGVAGDVTVTGSPMTFTTGNWNDAQTVTVRAAEDEDADPDPDVTLTHTVAGGGYAGVDASDVVVTVRENDTAAVTVNPTALTVTEGSSASYAVSLTSEPTGDVTVTVGGVAGDVTVTGSPMTFTTGNWNNAQTVTVRAAEDEDADPDPDVTLTHTVSGGGYAGVAASDVVVTVTENDDHEVEVSLVLTPSTISENGGLSTVTASVSHPGAADFTVTVFASALPRATDQDFVLSTNSVLRFEAGARASDGAVTITAVDNDVHGTDKRVRVFGRVSEGANASAPPDMFLTVNEDDEVPSVDICGRTPVVRDYILELLKALRNHVGRCADVTTEDLADLTFIHLSGQGIEVLNSGDFAGLTGIRELILQDNALRTLPADIFAGLTALEQLNLAYNEIEILPEGIFYELQSLAKLNLRDNELTAFPLDALEALPALSHLALEGNPGLHSGIEASPESLTVIVGESASYRVRLTRHTGSRGTTIDVGSDSESVTATPAVLMFNYGNWFRRQTVRVTAAAPVASAALSHRADEYYRVDSNPVVTVAAVSPAIAGASVDTGNVGNGRADGQAALSVADARAEEGTDETIGFAVTLDRAAPGMVSVDYVTTDGTATAGEDYTAASGTLTFAAGETEKTVSVPVLNDAKDEGKETFTLGLSNASGAWIEDGEATGTIGNSDPMPQAWLVRFGRTVAGQVVDAVTARLEGGGGSHVTVAGQQLGIDGAAQDGEEAREAEVGLEAMSDWLRNEDGEGATDRSGSRSLTGREVLLGSSFHLVSENEAGGSSFAAWGRVATGGFETDLDDVRLDGDVTTVIVGADVTGGCWLAGAAFSHSEGEGGYALVTDTESAFDKGEVESTLTSVYPYARVSLSERVSAWGLVGYGTGELTLIEESGERTNRYTTDIALRMGALGARGTLLAPDETGGFELAVRSDAFLVYMTSDATDGMMGSKAEASRERLVLDAARSFETDGGTLTPRLELGLRHDGGDAETGTGVEVGAGISYSGARVTIEGTVRSLVAHEDGAYEEWGASGSIRIDPGASGHGLSLTLAPTWGNASSGAERLWSLADTGGLAANDEFEAEHRLDAELGYGLGGPAGLGVVTPYAGLLLANGSERAWRAGARWQVARDFTLGLEGTRREAANDDAPEHGLMLRGALRW